MADVLRTQPLIQSDETPVRMQLPDGQMKTARLWAYGLPWAEVVFDFRTDKSHTGPLAFLRGARATHLQADGGSSYGPVLRQLSLQHIACMAHIRRKVFETRDISRSFEVARVFGLDKQAHSNIDECEMIHSQSAGYDPPRSENVFCPLQKVDATARERQNGHSGGVVWLTGLSASGKSTVATELERRLVADGWRAYVLDGDNLRQGLCSDLGFEAEDRRENIRRVGEVARLFADAGLVCIAALISPYRSDRDLARRIAPPNRFIEVYVNAPLEVCERRDPKGLYRKARAGSIPSFTGISAPYEPPLSPEIELRTDQQDVSQCVTIILNRTAQLRTSHLEAQPTTEYS